MGTNSSASVSDEGRAVIENCARATIAAALFELRAD
jgi:hypothetical protein